MLHKDVPRRSEVMALAEVEGRTCLSIYTPIEPTSDHPEANRIAFGNQVKKALDLVEDKSTRAALAEGLDDVTHDEAFWWFQSRTLVVLATEDRVVVYRVPNRLQAIETVGDRFYLKPLLRSVTFPQSAFVLALSESAVRLVEVTAEHPAVDVRIPELPTSASDYARKSSISGRADRGAMEGGEARKLRVRQYCRAIDQALRSVVVGQGAPLILAAAEPTASSYRSVNSSSALLDQGIDGNPEERTDAELADLARGVLDAHYDGEVAAAREVFETRQSQGRAQTDLSDIARSATYGRVDTLFVDIDGAVPGTIDAASGAVTFADGEQKSGYGVVDEIARRTLLQGGRILAVRSAQVPEGAPAAAILRFAP